MIPDECIPWEGSARNYQAAAARSLALDGLDPSPYVWHSPTCGTPNCLRPGHVKAHAPIKLAYPSHVCIYCGRHAYTKDHLFPRNWTGESKRKFTAIVPACGLCNTLLGETLTWSITERRAICHERIRTKFASALRAHDYTAAELTEFGHTLRTTIEDGLAKKAEVLRMLAWPEDPTFDVRALELSGIEDPYVLGLIFAESDIPNPSKGQCRMTTHASPPTPERPAATYPAATYGGDA